MTGCTVVPGGAGRVTLAATRSTSAPRSTAARARAQPIRPEERLPRNRTGSRCSRVPPALTTTRRPARSRAAARCTIEGSVSTAVATAASSAGSGSRPGPVSGPVSRPESGSTTMQPRDRERVDVGLGGRVQPHLGVHRRSEDDRAVGGQQGGGEQVVGPAGGGPGQQIGGGRCDEHQVGLLTEPDVRHLVHVVEHRRVHRACPTGRPRWRRRRTRSAAAVGITVTS